MAAIDLVYNTTNLSNMGNFTALSGGLSSVTKGDAIAEAAQLSKEVSDFQNLLDSITRETETKESAVPSSRLNGDYLSSFSSATNTADTRAKPQGEAANSANPHIPSHSTRTIDKSSALYEKSLELESYFVKIMLSSMKNTINLNEINGKESYASSMYTDMLYDEYNVILTKNAGFGLADQIYLQLSDDN
ncbi:MAG TPA: rod-binding protein [Treponemataceae bacterium]|jgi:flagellar protein FlgJ|nr:rod-binding protein [Treponemataceae bacterium]HQC26638.1 rod-binding protein [Treponemataceae bacterium]